MTEPESEQIQLLKPRSSWPRAESHACVDDGNRIHEFFSSREFDLYLLKFACEYNGQRDLTPNIDPSENGAPSSKGEE